jgi:hypothetical protein
MATCGLGIVLGPAAQTNGDRHGHAFAEILQVTGRRAAALKGQKPQRD